MASTFHLHLDRLVCPVCHASLRLHGASGAEAIDCTGCLRRYPVVDGLPVLIASRATPVEIAPK